jgi:hypothetical protein
MCRMGIWPHHWKEQDPSKCPGCNADNEYHWHVGSTCPARSASVECSKVMEDLCLWCASHETEKDRFQLINSCLSKRRSIPTFFMAVYLLWWLPTMCDGLSDGVNFWRTFWRKPGYLFRHDTFVSSEDTGRWLKCGHEDSPGN